MMIADNTDRYELDKKLDHYNLNDGLDLLYQIINHPNCELGTALKAFYLAEGERYLRHDIAETESTKKRLALLECLYKRITNGHYIGRFVGFTLSLTKVQKYRLLKAFTDTPAVFLDDITGSKTAERCEQCFVFGISDSLVLCQECNVKALRVEVIESTYSVSCANCGYGVACTCFRPCVVNDTTPREEFSKYKECGFRV